MLKILEHLQWVLTENDKYTDNDDDYETSCKSCGGWIRCLEYITELASPAAGTQTCVVERILLGNTGRPSKTRIVSLTVVYKQAVIVI